MLGRTVSRFILVAVGVSLMAGPEPDRRLSRDIDQVAKQGRGSAAGRAAWNRVVAAGPAALPRILSAMDRRDIVAANWLRTAFDRIVEESLQTNRGKGIDVEALLAFARDERRQGRARRLALEVVERLRPGTSGGFYPGWLYDPEFRYEAVEVVIKAGDALVKESQRAKAVAAYRKAFAAVRDLQQAKTVAARLEKAGVRVSVARHLGFLTDWYVIGPFDAMGLKGFKTVYAPEKSVDLAAELQGKEGKVRWKRYRVRETPPTAAGAHVALVNLREPLGDADDAVGFAYTEFTVRRACESEFRGAADDNFTVWVNGKREFGFEEYRNGVRFDRHRFRVKLKAGKNTVLVKVCQYLASAEPNWEFLLRVVDDTGKGIDFTDALPAAKN
jgi:hypothetical protein